MASTPRNRLVRPAARAAALTLGLLAALGVGLALAAPASAAAHSIVIKQYAYSSSSLTISQGDTVTWTNQDSVGHDVLVTQGPQKFQSPMLAHGQSWSHTFTTAGAYSYICSVHPDMTASITVRAAATPTAAAPPHSHAPATTAAATTAPPPSSRQTARASGHQAAATAAATAVAAPGSASQQVAAPLAPTEASLDPLLLVAGVSTGVTVFCLLLMTSRPVVQPAESRLDADDPEGT